MTIESRDCMDVRFKIAEESDIEEIIALCNRCFTEETPIAYAKEIFLKTKDTGKDIYLIGIVNSQIVAHAKITIIDTMYQPMMRYAILNHVCVDESYRRHNIATHMLEEIEKICTEKNCVKMELWSNNVRTAAHACYKNFGFGLDDAGFFSKKIGGSVYEN